MNSSNSTRRHPSAGMPEAAPAACRAVNELRILYIVHCPASIRSMQHLFARRIDLDLVAVQCLGVGLEIAAYQGFDLILLDVDFQKGQGGEELRCVRSDPQFARTPVVAISTQPLPGDNRVARELGFDECVMKPIGTRLLRFLDRLLSGPGAPQHNRHRPAVAAGQTSTWAWASA